MFGFRKDRKRAHRKAKKLISIYLDGELDEVRKKELSDHLSACKECRNELKELEAAHSYLLEALKPEEVDDIWTGVEEKIFELGKGRESRLPFVFAPMLRPAVYYVTAAIFGIFIGAFSGALSAGFFETDSYTTSTFAGLGSRGEPSTFEYLEKTPPNSLTTLYFGSNLEERDD
jgi:anti-sigma factor RsiW